MLQTDTQIGWQDYLAIIGRRRLFFILPCTIIVIGTMMVGMVLPKIYRAETILLVEDQNVINPLIQGLAVSTPVAERLRTLREELLSWTSLSRLVHELKLDEDAKSPSAFERLIKRLQQDIHVRMRGSDLVMISYEDRDPKLAQTLVNTITKVYTDRNIESQSAEAETAISFIESEMTVYKKALEDAERALREFKELYVMQMPVANQLNEQIVDREVKLAQLLIENTEAHPTVVEMRRQIEELKRHRNNEIKRVITTALSKGADPTIYQDLATALNEPLNPDEDAKRNPTIRAAKEAYRAWVERLDTTLAKQNEQPIPQVQVVTTTKDPNSTTGGGGGVEIIGSSTSSLSLGPREEQELARLTRDYDVHSKTYQQMQERLERAKITQRLGDSDEGTKFKMLEPARLPLHPVRPNLAKFFIFALFLGSLVGAGIAFVAEYLDQSFQTAEDLQQALGIPVVGSISTIVTEADLEARRKRRAKWVSIQNQVYVFRTYIVQPVWNLLDRVLVRWGL